MDISQIVEDAYLEVIARASADTLLEAQKMSSGPFSLAQLAKDFDGPFSWRHGSPAATGYPLDPEVINKQSGRFYAAWRVIDAQISGGTVTGGIINDSPEADFLKAAGDPSRSTSTARPIEAYLRTFFMERLAFYLDESLISSMAS